MERYSRLVLTISQTFSTNSDEAFDIAQEVFLRAFRKLNSFDTSRPFASWLYVLALNVAKNFRRSREAAYVSSNAHIDEVSTYTADPLELLIVADEHRFVKEKLSLLPKKQRETFILHSINGFNLREVAEIMGCSDGTARSNYFEAVKKLAAILRKSRE